MSFDCFNEDLAWILSKLVARTGGSVGVISGQLTAEDQPTLLASFASDTLDPRLLLELTGRAAGVPFPTGEHSHDQPNLSHGLMSDRGAHGAARRYRLLHLTFSPAADIKIVATVAKESRLGFKFLEDVNARRLYPVLSRYVRLWWAHRTERKSAVTLRAVIDASELGICLLNRDGRLLYANSRASDLLAARDGMSRDEQRIKATSESDRGRFNAAIDEVLLTNQMAGAETRTPLVLALTRNDDKRDLILAVLPVGTPALVAEDPAVVVYGLDPDQNTEALMAPVCSIYKLTAAEARLAGQLVSGYTIADAARRINIQPQTARAYLKSIFSKTKTHRQAELVRVMLSSILRTSAT